MSEFISCLIINAWFLFESKLSGITLFTKYVPYMYDPGYHDIIGFIIPQIDIVWSDYSITGTNQYMAQGSHDI